MWYILYEMFFYGIPYTFLMDISQLLWFSLDGVQNRKVEKYSSSELNFCTLEDDLLLFLAMDVAGFYIARRQISTPLRT